jgi:hypothetical protein
LDASGGQQQYEPDSDMDFLDFKARIKSEWDARPPTVPVVAAAARRWWCF